MKKLISVLLSIIIALSMTACNVSTQSSESSDNGNNIQTENTPNGSYRIFDCNSHSVICENILPMFAISSNISWHKEDSAPLLEAVGSGIFKYLVESLYTLDTGKEFDNKDGRISVDTYIEYGTKYFDLYAEDIKAVLTSCSTYNADDNTVLMHDGLGCVTGIEPIAVTAVDNNYVVDYAVCYPEEAQLRYGYMVFSVNDDGSYKFISNNFTDTMYNPSYDLNNYYYAEGTQIATSRDGKYDVYKAYTLNLGLRYREIRLKNKETGHIKSLGFVVDNRITDAGFFSNGDVYTMDYSGLYVHSTDMTIHDAVFATKTNFNAGSFIGYDGKERYVFAVRRDPEKFDYIVIYGEYAEDADYNTAHPNNFQLAYDYKIGLLDKNGNLTQSWDTGVPIMYSAYGFESVYMSKPSENEIEFFAEYNGDERFRARFDLVTGSCTTLKAFAVPADQKIEKVKQLADQWVPALSVWLGSDWESDFEELDFGLHRALMGLYSKDKVMDFPVIAAKQPNNYLSSEAVRVSDLVPVAEKFFAFDTDKLYSYYRSLSGYDSYNDSIILGDGWGWSLDCRINSVVAAVGDRYEVYYDLVDTENNIVESKVLTAELKDNSYLQYISNREISKDVTNIAADETLLLDANILSGYLSLCLDTNTTPETPKFNYAQFLRHCAVDTQKDFCYYSLFSRVNEKSGDYLIDYGTAQKLIGQVFNDGEWVENWFEDAETSGESYSKEDNSIIMPTEVGGVWFYYAGEDVYSEFSADNTQVISHLELFAPDASSGDPGHKSLGDYNIVFDICTENGETFLRFNRFEKNQ